MPAGEVGDEAVLDDEVVSKGMACVMLDLGDDALDDLTLVLSLAGNPIGTGTDVDGERGGDDNPEESEADDEALRFVPRGEESRVIGATESLRFGDEGTSFSEGLPLSLGVPSWIEAEPRDMVSVMWKRSFVDRPFWRQSQMVIWGGGQR